jgi:hypothetical protein
MKFVTPPCHRDAFPALSLRRVVRNSALLNVVIVLTSFPVLFIVGGPKALVPSLAIMAGISVLIWTVTFALYTFASLVRIFRREIPSQTWVEPAPSSEELGVADRWLDGPA